MKKLRRVSSVLAAALLAIGSPAFAQTITGRVVSSTGAGVPGVNIDAFVSADGTEATLTNDGTDSNGNFTTIIEDGAGVYDVVFYPPAPPATTHLVGERTNVVVVTTTNLGTITLGAGVLLSGRAVRTGSIPVANVSLSVVDAATQSPIPQNQTETGAFGTFNLAVPTRRIELRLDATTSSFVLGSRALERLPGGNTALGDILLPPGAVVTGHLQRANGNPVAGLDLDFRLSATGRKAYVPNDNTNAQGNFSVIVGRGTYDIELCPKSADLLVAREFPGVPIFSNLNTGTTVLLGGVRLFGTVRNGSGAPLQGVDADVFHATTGAEIPLCNDNTNAAGAYSVVVPTGTYDVLFMKPGKLQGDLHENVPVPGQTQLDGQIISTGTGQLAGGSPIEPLAPAAGPPRLARVNGAPGVAPELTLDDHGDAVRVNGQPRSLALLVSSTNPSWLLPGPAVRVHALRLDAAGQARIALDRLSSIPGRATYVRVLARGPDGRWIAGAIGALGSSP